MIVSHVPPKLLVAALAAVGLAAPTAVAKPSKPPASGCPTAGQLSRPFPGDPFWYFLAPGGAFEDAAWPGGGRARENEPDHVHGRQDRWALAVPAGASATSPATCIGLASPTVRYYARQTSGLPGALLGLAVTFEAADGSPQTLALAPATSVTGGWFLVTPATPILANATVLPKALGSAPPDATLATGNVRFVFTAPPGSSWLVDDVYVDPYSRH